MIRGALGRALERGALESSVTRAAASVWARHADVVRPVAVPALSTVIGVGGTTLGGSYKTPLVLALAVALRQQGERVRVVGHGYGARAGAARSVRTHDTARSVGDDAAWLARELCDADVPVFVGPRSDALALAADPGSVVLVDSLLQARPRRLSLSLLAVDAEAPWGRGVCPPVGDLRAGQASLLAAADAVVAVHSGAHAHPVNVETTLPVFHVTARLGATLAADGDAVALASLSTVRVGLVVAIARPDRVVRALGAHGVSPVVTRRFGDHVAPRESRAVSRRAGVELWLTTPKCATKLGAFFDGVPLAVLRHDLQVPGELSARCREALAGTR